MKIILTRHTKTDWNLARRIQGQTDIPLCPQGINEAKQLAELILGLNVSINLIVSSDLKRAHETAEIINAKLGAPLRLERKLRECHFGNIEGLTREQSVEKHGQSMVQNWDDQFDDYDFRTVGGEHRKDVLARHQEVLKSLVKEKSNKTILLVGHGRGMCTLLASLGHPPNLKQGEYRIIEYHY